MNERIVKILDDPKTIPAVVGLLSFGAGAGIGYILGRRRKFDVYVKTSDIPDVEVAFDTSGLADQTEEKPKFVVDAKTKELKDLQFQEIHFDPTGTPGPNGEGAIISVVHVEDDEEPEEGIVLSTGFAESEDGWDYEEEIKHRSKDEPYVIHRDEFFEDDDEFDYRQVSLTYYEGDDMMVDDQNAPVYNYSNAIGPLKFGHGSGEANIFYVRNPKLRMDYEIVKNDGHYAVEVMGLEIEDEAEEADLKHSAVPKFRDT